MTIFNIYGGEIMDNDISWISCSLPLGMKEDLEAYVNKNNYNKSEFIRKLIRDAIYS
jgi:Arc/MetJ-type ribon-helix-helix transcriptional regulator